MPPAVIAAAVVGMAAISATSQIAQGMQAKTAGEYQAQQENQAATVERMKGGQEIASQDYKANEIMGAIRASAGAAGVDPGSGSVERVSASSAQEARLNDTYIKFNSNYAASQDVYKGAIAKYQGKQAFYGSLIGAGGTILSSLIKVGAPPSAGGLGYNPFTASSGGAPTAPTANP